MKLLNSVCLLLCLLVFFKATGQKCPETKVWDAKKKLYEHRIYYEYLDSCPLKSLGYTSASELNTLFYHRKGNYKEWSANGTLIIDGNYATGLDHNIKHGAWYERTDYNRYIIKYYHKDKLKYKLMYSHYDSIHNSPVLRENQLIYKKDTIFYSKAYRKDSSQLFSYKEINDKEVGKTKYWHRNGRLVRVNPYKNGKRHGKWVHRYEDGTLRRIIWYKDDEYIKCKLFRDGKFYKWVYSYKEERAEQQNDYRQDAIDLEFPHGEVK